MLAGAEFRRSGSTAYRQRNRFAHQLWSGRRIARERSRRGEPERGAANLVLALGVDRTHPKGDTLYWWRHGPIAPCSRVEDAVHRIVWTYGSGAQWTFQ